MSVLFGGFPCLDPASLSTLAKAALRGRRVNAYDCPLGGSPGYADLVVSRWLLDQLSLQLPQGSKFRELEFFDGNNPNLIFKNFVVTGHATALTSGMKGDEATAYLLRVADKRWLHWDRGEKINAAYNMRSRSDGAYYSGTLNAGVAYTWAQLLTALWPSGMGTAPTLPFTPDGTPEGFWYAGMSKLQAVEDFLNRLSCKVKYNPMTSICTIVRLGTDATVDDFLAKYSSVRNWDDYPVTGRIASWPKTIRVQFRVRSPYSNGASPVYSIDQTVTTYPAVFQADNTIVVLDDDLFAQNVGGSITNTSALTTRATERRTDWERKRRYFDTGETRVYVGSLNLVQALGGKWSRLLWSDDASGIKTTLTAGVNDDRDVWQSRNDFPEVVGGTEDIRSFKEPGRWHQPDLLGTGNQDPGFMGTSSWEWYYIAEGYPARILLVPFVLPHTSHLTQIGTYAHNRNGTDVNLRLGLYHASNRPADIFAHTLTVDAGNKVVAAGAIGEVKVTVDLTLAPGLYWVAIGLASDGYGYVGGFPPTGGLGISYVNLNWPGLSNPAVPVSPAPIGTSLAGTLTVHRLGYHVAYPNSATRGNTQGALPASLLSPTLDDTGVPGTWLLYGPNLSLYFASFTGTGGGGAGSASVAPVDAQYVTLATNSTLTVERVLTEGAGIAITDGGANGAVTIATDGTGDVDGGTAP
jgi:hypothetical protein